MINDERGRKTRIRAERVRALLYLLLAALGCRAAGDATQRAAPPDAALANRLQHLVDSTVAQTPSIPGLIVHVEAPKLRLAWSAAAGVFDRATGEKLTADHMFRIASNTKTYVAAAVLRLAEEGKLRLTDPIARHLAPNTTASLRAGGYDPHEITVHDLLQHVSGLYDYATDPTFAETEFGEPGHRWTRTEQLQFAVQHGKPYGRPGAVYHYSDTGYILLGEIIERLTGSPLGTGVRELLGFDRLGLAHTYFESLDSVPPGSGARAHQYADSTDIFGFDPSFDLYGGGGIVSTIGELARFYRALLQGEVLRDRATLDTMLLVSRQSLVADSTRGYAMGIGRRHLGTLTCWGHGGYWGSVAVSCPTADITVAITVNRSPDPAVDGAALVRRIIELVEAASRP
ncbi:MAG: serine hydrolase domain-containing protein [Gemmatimonadota bacterium]